MGKRDYYSPVLPQLAPAVVLFGMNEPSGRALQWAPACLFDIHEAQPRSGERLLETGVSPLANQAVLRRQHARL